MKTVTIEIPDDSELIKEGNIYKIYRVIPKTWEEFCNRTPIRREYFIGYDSKINLRENKGRAFCGDRNLYASEVEAEATLALTQLIRLRKAWVGEWDAEIACANIYYIQSTIDGELTVSFISRYVYRHTLTFPSKSMTTQFIECFRDLLNRANRFLA